MSHRLRVPGLAALVAVGVVVVGVSIHADRRQASMRITAEVVRSCSVSTAAMVVRLSCSQERPLVQAVATDANGAVKEVSVAQTEGDYTVFQVPQPQPEEAVAGPAMSGVDPAPITSVVVDIRL